MGVAPISCCSLRMSRVGPAMRDVPVSTIAWQPLGQKESIPWTATLRGQTVLLPPSGCSVLLLLSNKSYFWLLKGATVEENGINLSILICQYPLAVTGSQLTGPVSKASSIPPSNSSPCSLLPLVLLNTNTKMRQVEGTTRLFLVFMLRC